MVECNGVVVKKCVICVQISSGTNVCVVWNVLSVFVCVMELCDLGVL